MAKLPGKTPIHQPSPPKVPVKTPVKRPKMPGGVPFYPQST